MLFFEKDASSVMLSVFDGPGRDDVTELLSRSGAGQQLGLVTVEDRPGASWTGATEDRASFRVLGELVSRDTWARLSRPEERAIVVLRDPRDLVTWAARHAEDGFTIDGLTARERLIAAIGWLKGQEAALRSWAGRSSSTTELVTSYEAITANEQRFFAELANFLDVPGTLHGPPRALFAADRIRVEPGDAGVGAWRASFDGDVAAVFETILPSLVADLGYDDADWATRHRSAHHGESGPDAQVIDLPKAAPAAESAAGSGAMRSKSLGLFDR